MHKRHNCSFKKYYEYFIIFQVGKTFSKNWKLKKIGIIISSKIVFLSKMMKGNTTFKCSMMLNDVHCPFCAPLESKYSMFKKSCPYLKTHLFHFDEEFGVGFDVVLCILLGYSVNYLPVHECRDNIKKKVYKCVQEQIIRFHVFSR